MLLRHSTATLTIAIVLIVGLEFLRMLRRPMPPYPLSSLVSGVVFYWSTHKRAAPGSGDWGITWADDDNQYAAWGNGGGFGGTGSDGRVSLGVVRVEGNEDNYECFNVWGGKNPEHLAQFGGKAYTLLSVDSKLYMWRCGATDGVTAYDFQELYVSNNHSQTWKYTGVRFSKLDFGQNAPGFFCPVFLQYGKDYQGSRDEYVYIYAPEIQNTDEFQVQRPGQISLIRVPKERLTEVSKYEYFAGLSKMGQPIWSQDLTARRPAFQDDAGVMVHLSVVYNSGLNRYILITEHSKMANGNIGIFEAPNPWGPWATILYETSFGDGAIPDNTMMWVLPSKWLSRDGTRFTMIFTGKEANDSWNTVRGSFVLSKQ